jgi:L-lactate dehydrogenase complex protein LldG
MGVRKPNPLRPRSATPREEILGRLRAALARPALPFPPPNPPPLTSETRMQVTSVSGGMPALTERFAAELAALHGTCEIADSAAEARLALVNRIQMWHAEEEAAAKGARLQTGQEKMVLGWSPNAIPLEYVAEALLDTGFTLVSPKSLFTREERDAVRHIRYGITGVEAAFATTGSILVASGAETNRVASLMPYRHIALIPFTRLYANIEQWLAVQRERDLPAFMRGHASINMITGPSKSADIEQNLTRGVHGPKYIHAILFDDTADFAEPYYGVFKYGEEDDEEILGGLLSASRRIQREPPSDAPSDEDE